MQGGRTNRERPGGPAWLGLTASAILVFTAIAGCIDAVPQDGEVTENQEPTLAAPPKWRVGQWWTVEVEDRLTGSTVEGTLVVSDRTETGASIGMPTDRFEHRFFIYHLPPLGEIELDTFTWNVMGHDFEALHFPLEDGKEWSTVFHGLEYGWEVQAEVTRVEGSTADVRMIGDNVIIDLTYDAEIGMITHFDADAYGVAFHMTDHGYDHEGQVDTPSEIDLGFLDGRVATVLDPTAMPVSPLITLEVENEVSHGTLALMASGLPQLGSAGPGVYRAKATSPEGDSYETTFTPGPEDPLFLVQLEGIVDVQGTWELEFESAGPGLVAAELIVYDLTQTSLIAGS